MKQALALSAALICGSAQAEFFDGNRLLQKCESASSSDRIDCLGYTSGVFDAKMDVSHCAPDAVTRGQVRDIVVEYLRQSPAIRHYSADILAGNAFTALWP